MSQAAPRSTAFGADAVAAWALRQELDLSPKPGLVDRLGNGAHQDMCHALFVSSIEAIQPWLQAFLEAGRRSASLSPQQSFALVRPLGLHCEAAMFAATGGVNTHKGAIFAFALLLAATGRLEAQRRPRGAEPLCAEVAHMCKGLAGRELGGDHQITAGQRVYARHGLTGARGEAESGFATVRYHALPVYRQALAAGLERSAALQLALLQLMACNPDTNLVHRGGMEGLALVQHTAQTLLAEGAGAPPSDADLLAFDRLLTAQRLSPGGSADLLAVTCFLEAVSA